MKMNTLLPGIILALVSLLGLGQPASAQPNTFSLFSETVTNTCTEFCTGVTLATDPLSGLTTVEYTLVPLPPTAPPLNPGDFLFEESPSSTIGDVLRFEDINGSNVVFVFSNDVSTGLPADVGLPSSFQTLAHTLDGEDFSYTMVASDPGAPYTFTFDLASADAPEPGTITLLGTALIGLAVLMHRRRVR